MPKRPLSVTIVGYLIIFQAALNFLGLVAARSNPEILQKALPPGTPIEDVVSAIPMAMFACVFVCLIGISVLRGLNWSRIALAALAVFAILLAVLQGNSSFFLSAIMFGLMSFALYRQNARDFFRKGGGQAVQNPPTDDQDPPNGGNSATFIA